MLSIDKDNQSAGGDRFRVTVRDAGFGSWTLRHLSLDAALELVRHYYGRPHNTAECGACEQSYMPSRFANQ